jgi:hypothetical protein
MKLVPEIPQTVADQTMLCLALILFSCTITMISLVIQQKPIPPDFKEFAQYIATGVFAGFGFNRLTK